MRWQLTAVIDTHRGHFLERRLVRGRPVRRAEHYSLRRLASEQLGSFCPTGLVPPAPHLISALTADWLAEFERVQLILRLSPRLRAKHDD